MAADPQWGRRTATARTPRVRLQFEQVASEVRAIERKLEDQETQSRNRKWRAWAVNLGSGEAAHRFTKPPSAAQVWAVRADGAPAARQEAARNLASER